MDHPDLGLKVLGGKLRAGVTGQAMGDKLGVGENARGMTEGQAKRRLFVENRDAIDETIAEGLDLRERGRHHDAETVGGDGGDEAVGFLSLRPENIERAAQGEEI